MDAPRNASIDAFIFSPRSQTSGQILRKNIPKLGPKDDLWLRQENILLSQQENTLLLQQGNTFQLQQENILLLQREDALMLQLENILMLQQENTLTLQQENILLLRPQITLRAGFRNAFLKNLPEV